MLSKRYSTIQYRNELRDRLANYPQLEPMIISKNVKFGLPKFDKQRINNIIIIGPNSSGRISLADELIVSHNLEQEAIHIFSDNTDMYNLYCYANIYDKLNSQIIINLFNNLRKFNNNLIIIDNLFYSSLCDFNNEFLRDLITSSCNINIIIISHTMPNISKDLMSYFDTVCMLGGFSLSTYDKFLKSNIFSKMALSEALDITNKDLNFGIVKHGNKFHWLQIDNNFIVEEDPEDWRVLANPAKLKSKDSLNMFNEDSAKDQEDNPNKLLLESHKRNYNSCSCPFSPCSPNPIDAQYLIPTNFFNCVGDFIIRIVDLVKDKCNKN